MVWPIMSVGEHQAFEFFEPGEEDFDLGSVWMWRAISGFTK